MLVSRAGADSASRATYSILAPGFSSGLMDWFLIACKLIFVASSIALTNSRCRTCQNTRTCGSNRPGSARILIGGSGLGDGMGGRSLLRTQMTTLAMPPSRPTISDSSLYTKRGELRGVGRFDH